LLLKQRENNAIWSLVRAKRYPDPYRKSDEAFASVYQLIEQAGNAGLKN
jgi:protein-tyrosine-phosphatase